MAKCVARNGLVCEFNLTVHGCNFSSNTFYFSDSSPAPPKVAMDVKNKDTVEIMKGQMMSLVACISGKPPPDVVWSKGNRPLIESPRIKFKVTDRVAIVTIHDVDRPDDGVYTCTVKNNSGVDDAQVKVHVLCEYTLSDVYEPKL